MQTANELPDQDVIGRWYCQLVDQEQSDEALDAHGDYPDTGWSRKTKAAKTEFAGATLDLHADGRYELAASEPFGSFGVWTFDGGQVSFSEADDCRNGFERLEYAGTSGAELTMGFKLVPDAHDGLDILVLTFSREAPVERAVPEGFVEKILAAEEGDNEFYAMLDDELQGEHGAARARELWDAWKAGKLAADRDSKHFEIELSALTYPGTLEGGAFTVEHALHALTLDPAVHNQLAYTIEDAIVRLPEDEAGDAAIAAVMTPQWIVRFAGSRLTGGGPPAAFFRRKLFPQPAMDDTTRQLLASCTEYTRFEEIADLYPGAHPDLPSVAIRYRGHDLLMQPLALLEQRNLLAETYDAAAAYLEAPTRGIRTHGAAMWAVFLAGRLARPIPEGARRYLQEKKKQAGIGALSVAEGVVLAEAITGFKKPEQKKILKFFERS